MKFKRLLNSLLKQNIGKTYEIPVAFSGGPDSIFLTEGLINLGYKPFLIYINYHDSPTVYIEERIVKDYAKRRNLRLLEHEVKIQSSCNFEDEARKIRYKFFAETIKDEMNKFILTAHHKNDDIETILLQQQRKNIVDHYGLKENNYIFNVNVIRPILEYTKLEIVDYLKENNIEFYDDPTNYEQKRQRNILRKNLQNIDYHYYDDLKKELNNKIALEKKNIEDISKNIYIEKEKYTTLSEEEKRRLLNDLLIKYIGYSTSNLINICSMRLKSSKVFKEKIKDNIFLFQDKKYFFFGKINFEDTYSYKIDKEGLYQFNEFDIEIKKGFFNVKEFPIYIERLDKNDVIKTNIKQNDALKFLKRHGVPSFVIEFYPVIKDKNKNVIYVPFYEDIKNKTIPLKLKNITLEERINGIDVPLFYPF